VGWEQLSELGLVVKELPVLPDVFVVPDRQTEGTTHGEAGRHHLKVDAVSLQVPERQGLAEEARPRRVLAGLTLSAQSVQVVGQPDGQGFPGRIVVGSGHA
jgi:hypothetical protein